MEQPASFGLTSEIHVGITPQIGSARLCALQVRFYHSPPSHNIARIAMCTTRPGCGAPPHCARCRSRSVLP